ncbi:MAG TPA: ScpA family protein [Terriglobales bacterium]|nr:ScpA family protein [Terriglobales bacterium]
MTAMDDHDEIGETPAETGATGSEAVENAQGATGEASAAEGREDARPENGETPDTTEETAPAATDNSGAHAAGESQPAAAADAAFDAPVVVPAEDGGDLVLDLDGYEGPIDVLLTLARDQKVDLKKISILELADQYLAFVAKARRLRLELAADYLVMAAWLAYLKSRLLLPEPPKDGEPSGAEMAAALAFQLQRLAAMQKAGQALLALPQLNRDFFRRGEPEPVRLIQVPVYNLTLYELLKAYGTHPGRKREGILHIEPLRLFSMDDALHRIGDLIGHKLDWTILRDFLPQDVQYNPLQRRAALAATFAASLELARSGRVQLRQDGTFGPIYLKPGIPRDWDAPSGSDGGGSDASGSGGSGSDNGTGGGSSGGPDTDDNDTGGNPFGSASGVSGDGSGVDLSAHAPVMHEDVDLGVDDEAGRNHDFNQGNHA